MEKSNNTNSDKTNTFGEWILAHRPKEELLSFLLLPLCTGAMINTAILAMFLSDCGTFGNIVSWILIIIVAIASYGIFLNYLPRMPSHFL